MKILILLHSTTGNTRLMAEFAASHFTAAGHEARVIDIVHRPEPPDLAAADLVGFACPTMYFRPTLGMQHYVLRLPPQAGTPKPAFLFNTSAGEPGAHFSLLAEWLEPKGYRVLGAHGLLASPNLPLQIYLMRPLVPAAPLGRWLARVTPALRPLWGTFWADGSAPDERDRDAFRAFLDAVAARAAARPLPAALPPAALASGVPGAVAAGRAVDPRVVARFVRLRVHASRCIACGTCLQVCPVGAIAQPGKRTVPTIGPECSGCFACFNQCPAGAISAFCTPPGWGRYAGPSVRTRRLFAP